MLQHTKHMILTGFGLSEQTYGGDVWVEQEAKPMMGVGQGNGAGPAIWVAISTLLLQIMENHGFGTQLTSAMMNRTCSLVGYAFVDNMDLVHTATHPKIPIKSLTTQFQQAVDCWIAGMVY